MISDVIFEAANRAGHLAALGAAVVALSACDRGPEPVDPTELDPMIQRALNDPIMVDPDLVSQNMANAALTFEIGQPLPPEISGQAATIAAREEALAQIGGSSALAPMPRAEAFDGLSAAEALNAVGRAQRLAPPDACAAASRFSAIWAARLPDALSIYPRGSTKEALGGDAAICRLRSVVYLTPVPVDEVLAYHNTRAGLGGYASQFSASDEWQVLSGTKGRARFEIAARTLPSGLSEISIASLEPA